MSTPTVDLVGERTPTEMYTSTVDLVGERTMTVDHLKPLDH
jgi:hypothetical protein